MDTITIFPENEKQKSLRKSLLQEMRVHLEESKTKKCTILAENEFDAKIIKYLLSKLSPDILLGCQKIKQ